MRKYGFKIFSTILNTAPTLLKECVDFANAEQDVFLELMVLDDSSEQDLLEIKRQTKDIEVRIHAPHNIMGFDVGNKNLINKNSETFALSQKAADIFNSKTIIVHAGCGRGDEYIKETVRQIKQFNDKRIVVENLPLVASNMEPLHGNTAQEIKFIMDETGCGFCFDFSHAIGAAIELNLDIEKHLKSLFDLHPNVYHMCDGHIADKEDMHLHFGTGDYPLKHFLNDFTDKDAYITMETGKGIRQHADSWIKDYEYIKSI